MDFSSQRRDVADAVCLSEPRERERVGVRVRCGCGEWYCLNKLEVLPVFFKFFCAFVDFLGG